MIMRKSLSLILLGVLAAGCASANPTQKGAGAGAVLGAGLGAIIGHQSGHTGEGALIGAAAGGLGGAVVGNAMSSKFCPTCGREETGGVANCPIDGTVLRQKGAPAQTAQQQEQQDSLPKFCSTCGRSYPENKSYCSEDGTELKPKQS